jgi:hypothetical protein
MTEESLSSVEFIYCGCGCGKTLSKYIIEKDGRVRKDRPKKFIKGHHMYTKNLKNSMRQCLYFSECGKREIHNGIKWQQLWLRYQVGYICMNHYITLIRRPKIPKSYHRKFRRTPEQNKIINKKYNKIYHPRRFRFKDKSISLKSNPRIGYCSWCPNNIHDGSCRLTNMHHIEYYIIFPWFGTVELCVSCHNKETQRQLKLKKMIGK